MTFRYRLHDTTGDHLGLLEQVAEPVYEGFCEALELEGVRVARGVFGARMEVSLVNDGPVTIVLDTP